MRNLWAPWRMKYILSEKGGRCIFCLGPGKGEDKKKYVLYRGRFCFLLLNTFPYNNGHLLATPYRHVAGMMDLRGEELEELGQLVARSTELLKSCLEAEGFNIGINMGKIAGAGVADHLHVHVVPRWPADTNFMPVVGRTKVIPEDLDTTYERLRSGIEKSSLFRERDHPEK